MRSKKGSSNLTATVCGESWVLGAGVEAAVCPRIYIWRVESEGRDDRTSRWVEAEKHDAVQQIVYGSVIHLSRQSEKK